MAREVLNRCQKAFQTTFSWDETMAYLDVPFLDLLQLVHGGKLKLRQQGKRRYFLAGEVEYIKPLVTGIQNMQLQKNS